MMRALSLSSAVVLALQVGAVAHAADDRVFDQQVAAEPRGTVEISNVAGKVEVSGWDRPEVSVHGDLQGGVDRIELTSDRGRTTITVRLPGYSFHGGWRRSAGKNTSRQRAGSLLGERRCELN